MGQDQQPLPTSFPEISHSISVQGCRGGGGDTEEGCSGWESGMLSQRKSHKNALN